MTSPGNERRKLALIDVDGTLTTTISIWQYLMERTGCWVGAGEENLAKFLAKEISYAQFCDLDARLFAGKPYAELQDLAQKVVVREGVDKLLTHLPKRGYHVALISSGLRLMTDFFTDRFEISCCVVNDLTVHAGVCTGKAIINIDDGEKGVFAKKLIAEYRPEYVVAIGDSKGDLPMFAEADFAVAVDPGEQSIIDSTDLQVDGTDLSVLCKWI